jgi:hypothetical protein
MAPWIALQPSRYRLEQVLRNRLWQNSVASFIETSDLQARSGWLPAAKTYLSPTLRRTPGLLTPGKVCAGQKKHGTAILLLDDPGLILNGTVRPDLLRNSSNKPRRTTR